MNILTNVRFGWHSPLIGLMLLFSCPAMATELDKHSSQTPLSFGVVPQQSASKITRLWTPILDWLGSKSGHLIEVATTKNIPAFEKQLAQGGYDFSYMNPYHFTVFNDAPGYQAVARQKNKRIQGILVARKDSPLKSVADLRGERVSFPSPAAFAASILPRGSLKKAGIDFTPVYVSSHDSVYLTVARGLFPAGGGVVRTFRNTDPKVGEQLRVLWKSDLFTSHAIAVHPRVPKQTLKALQNAMMAMGEDPEGLRLLRAIHFKKGFEMAHNADWDDVRSLDIRLLDAPVDAK